MAKPEFPFWDSAETNNTEPPAAKKTAGAKAGLPESAQFFNWLFVVTWKWLRGLQGSYADIVVGSSAQVTAKEATHTVDNYVAAISAGDDILFLDGTHAHKNELITVADVTIRGESPEAILSFSQALALDQVWQVDADGGPSYVDETADANSASAADFLPFPATEAIGDWVTFGSARPFRKLILDNAGGTAGVGGVVVWEYWNGSTWTALTGVVDGTAGFTTPVADGQTVTWNLPADWAATVINASASLYYVRARITTVYSTNPVYDQAFIVSMLAMTGARARLEGGIRFSGSGTDDIVLTGTDGFAEVYGVPQDGAKLSATSVLHRLEDKLVLFNVETPGDADATITLKNDADYVISGLTAIRNYVFDASRIDKGHKVRFYNKSSFAAHLNHGTAYYTLDVNQWVEFTATADPPTDGTGWLKTAGDTQRMIAFEFAGDFSANTSNDRITSTVSGFNFPSGGYTDHYKVLRFTTTGTLPAPLQTGKDYFSLVGTGNSTTLSEYPGGPVIDITDTGTGTHSYTVEFRCPIGTFWPMTTVVGGGGGGGSGALDTTANIQSAGGGGGAAGTVIGPLAFTPGTLYPISIGDGGVGGAAPSIGSPGNAGSAGSATTFNGVTANGGGQGAGAIETTSEAAALGGSGGGASATGPKQEAFLGFPGRDGLSFTLSAGSVPVSDGGITAIGGSWGAGGFGGGASDGGAFVTAGQKGQAGRIWVDV